MTLMQYTKVEMDLKSRENGESLRAEYISPLWI